MNHPLWVDTVFGYTLPELRKILLLAEEKDGREGMLDRVRDKILIDKLTKEVERLHAHITLLQRR